MEPWKVHTDKAGSLKFRLANGWLSRVPGLADGTKRAEVECSVGVTCLGLRQQRSVTCRPATKGTGGWGRAWVDGSGAVKS